MNASIIPCQHVVFTDFESGEGVLVDLNTKRYYRLNETASFIWRALEKQRTPSEIATELEAAYDVSPQRAKESIGKLMDRLKANKLVK